MSKDIKLNLDELFCYVLNCEMNADAAKYYTPLLNDADKQKLIELLLELRLSGRNTWSDDGKAQVAPYILKFLPFPYKGNSYIKPITDLKMLQIKERYSMLDDWNFFISDSFFLYERDKIRALIKIEDIAGILTPKVLDSENYLTAKQRNTVLAEMNALMAEQS